VAAYPPPSETKVRGRMGSILVHIGYHKTGTNWLQRELFRADTGYRWLGKRPRSHPVRRFVRDRPLEFDPVEVRRAFDPMVAEVEEAGLLPVVSLERLSGHPFSGGFDSDRIAERLVQVFPEGRVLVVVREQRGMIVSTYKQYVQVGGACSLEHFLEPPRTRSERVPLFDARHFEYHRLVERYCGLFGDDRVLVLPYELFVRDGRGFVERIASFAGRPIPADVLDGLRYGRRSNQARSALTVAAVRRLNQFSERTEVNPAPVAEWRVAEWLSGWVQRNDALDGRLTKPFEDRSQARLRATVGDWAGERYAESNRRLAGLTGDDLGSYGWTL
jgi:sulfotransferase family protein